MNDKHDLGKTMEIRNRQLQTREHLHDNPLTIWNYNNINLFKNNFLAQTLCLMAEMGISIEVTNNNKNSYKIEGGNYPVICILDNEYRKEKNSLRNNNILYVDQLIYPNIMEIKEWRNINIENNKRTRERNPKYWTKIKKLLVDTEVKIHIIKKTVEEKITINNRIINQVKEIEIEKKNTL